MFFNISKKIQKNLRNFFRVVFFILCLGLGGGAEIFWESIRNFSKSTKSLGSSSNQALFQNIRSFFGNILQKIKKLLSGIISVILCLGLASARDSPYIDYLTK